MFPAFTLDQLGELEAQALAWDAAGRNVYFGIALRRLGFAKRGKREDCRAIPGFWLDIDLQGPSHAAKNLPATLEDAISLLQVYPQEPTLVVQSGHGLHVWWLFEEPLTFDRSDVLAVDQATKAWQQIAIDAAAKRGYLVDKTGDLARVLRVPGTHNHKDPQALQAVRLLDASGPRHPAASLVGHALASSKVITEGGPEEPTDTPAKAHPAPGEATLRDRLESKGKKLASSESKALLAQILAGESFAPLGQRDHGLQRAASLLAYLEPDVQPADLVAILAPSLATWEADDAGKWTQAQREAWALEKAERALEDAHENRERRKKQEAEIRGAIIGEARAAADPTLPFAPGAPGDDAPADLQRATYTPEELGRYAAQQGCSPHEFRRRWVIQKGPSYWVYVNGAYRAPLTKDELDVSLRRDLAPAPIDWTVIKADGGERLKTVAELLRDYSTVARSVEANLFAQVSTYDTTTQVFREAVCPVRPLVPRFHPQIAHWLSLLGGAHHDKLLDWIATVGMLDRASCALYLSGPPGTGKGMLALGLAKLWHAGGPTELRRVLGPQGQWTNDLARCPLVLADEELPDRVSTGEVRDFLGTTVRTLTRKYQSNASLWGAIRLILCANHDRILQVGDEDLTADDLEAVGGRFLHIPADASAKKYLDSIGGRTGTDPWVAGDMIAEHALHLRATRQVTPGRRFLVEAEVQEMHRAMATQGRQQGLVAEWLCKFLSNPTPLQRTPDGREAVKVGNGRLLVNASKLISDGVWTAYAPEWDRPPSINRAGRILGNMARHQVRLGTTRYHEIDHSLVLAFAERNQIGDPAAMLARINAEVIEIVENSAQVPPN